MTTRPTPTEPIHPARLLARLLASDPSRPRLTWYDDSPGPTAGERIELSGRVLDNWVAKAGNLLQDDVDAGPGTTVGLDLPAHWRAVYWALAAWSVGAEVVVGSPATSADVLVTSDPAAAAAHDGDAVLVSLPALARAHPEAASAPGAVDEARELATHGDAFGAMAEPEDDDVALAGDTGRTGAETYAATYAEVVRARSEWGEQPRVALAGAVAPVLLDVLSAWLADGSVVLFGGPWAPLEDRLSAEGVTHDLRATSA